MKLGRRADIYGLFPVVCKKTFQIKFRPPLFIEGMVYNAIIIERNGPLVEIMSDSDLPTRFTVSEFNRFFTEHITCPKEKKLL
ncbi:MAG: hypothetical protein ACKO8W_12060, partial [Dolichospermum sp.]